tara:strand:- start:329 stop:493 length:165 start_codon:yes stop_codon:yes gene_type:complete
MKNVRAVKPIRFKVIDEPLFIRPRVIVDNISVNIRISGAKEYKFNIYKIPIDIL